MSKDTIRFLMIDDDEDDFRIIEDIIKDIVHYKYSIDWTSSYNKGLEWIARKEHDVYLVDYNLGANTGLELIKEAVEQGCEAPLIILTSANNFEIDRQALKAGASDYLLKGSISGLILERSVRYALANANQRKEMRKLNSELEERVKNRTITLEQTLAELEKFQYELIDSKNKAELAAQKAEEASRSKTRFLSSMSHEIRTPMNAILGFTKLALHTDLTGKQREYLNAIKMSGDILTVLINDILDLAKVEAGKMTFVHAPFRLSSCTDEILQMFNSKVDGVSLKLEKEYDPSIPEVLIGDQVRLEQIILNLLSNAVKFTSKGKITVSVRMLNEDEEKATIGFAIRDTGIGIAENKLKTIFEEFEQASHKTSKIYGGTGLGLSIAKQFVELQGGFISVESKINEGSTFYFTLSFLKAKAETKTKKEIETKMPLLPKIKDVSVLVAEDEALNQLLIETIIEQFGFSIDVANDGKAAAEMLRKNKYDIVLMDLHMPVMDGFEATTYIRSEINSDIPIIALTADVTTIDVERCKAIGMNDYISKPIDDELLYATIIKYVQVPLPEKAAREKRKAIPSSGQTHINLEYLDILTDGNTVGKTNLIKSYLEEVPVLIDTMKQSISNSDWTRLRTAAHAMIPTFSLIGINKEFEEMARRIENNAISKENMEEVSELVEKIDIFCREVYSELKKKCEEQ